MSVQSARYFSHDHLGCAFLPLLIAAFSAETVPVGDARRRAVQPHRRIAMGNPDTRGYGPLLLIAITKLLKAVFLLALAAAMLRLVHRDVQEVLHRWAREVRVDPGSHFLTEAISKVAGVGDRQLEVMAVGAVLYAALFATEGTGLLLRKVWAEYLTVVSTALLLPIEIYELTRHTTAIRIGILVANVAIVIYLIWRLKDLRHEKRSAAGPATKPARERL